MPARATALLDPARLILLAPLVFVIHVLEEAPGFVAWFNSIVTRGISWELFLAVNIAAFAITLALSLLAAYSPSKGSLLGAFAWLSLLFFANAIFHIVATVVHARYCPGVVTAIAVYLPYFVIYAARLRLSLPVSIGTLIGISLVGGLPMYIHGYRIVFLADRLF